MTDYELFYRSSIPQRIKYSNWRDMKIGHFDLETTGVNPFDRTDTKIVQFCCKVVQRGRRDQKPIELNQMNVLVNPELPIPEGASRVHKIEDHHVEDEPPFEEYADTILHLMSGCDIVCAYNGTSYDVPLLVRQLIDSGYKGAMELFAHDVFCLDPLVFFRKEMGRFSKTQLINAAIEYNCQGVGSVAHGEFDLHNAFTDVEMMENLVWESKHIYPWSLDELVEKQLNHWLEQEEYLNDKYDDRWDQSVMKHIEIPIEEWDGRHNTNGEEE